MQTELQLSVIYLSQEENDINEFDFFIRMIPTEERNIISVSVVPRFNLDGKVVKNQYPDPTTTISTATNVFLLTDASVYTLPDVDGWSRKDVATYLQLLNVPVKFEGSGQVVNQSISEGTDVTTITELIITLE